MLPVCGLFLIAFAPAVAFGANRPAFWAPMALGALAMLVWSGRHVRPPPASALFLPALLWAALQPVLGYSADPVASWAATARLATYAALFLTAAVMARQAGMARLMIRVAALWVSALCAYGLAAWATGWNPIIAGVEAYPGQLESTFINPNAFALYAGFGVIACLAVSVQGRVWRPRVLVAGGWIWPVCMALIVAALFATGSRGGIAAAACGVGVYAMMRWGRKAKLIAGAIALFGVITALFLSETTPNGGFEADRLAVYAEVITGILDAPLTGHGFGAFQDAFRPYVTTWRWGDWDHAHQMYLETAFELGLPAAALLLGAIALVAVTIRRRARRRTSPALALGALSAAAAHSLVDFSLAIPSVAAALAIFLGLAWAEVSR